MSDIYLAMQYEWLNINHASLEACGVKHPQESFVMIHRFDLSGGDSSVAVHAIGLEFEMQNERLSIIRLSIFNEKSPNISSIKW